MLAADFETEAEIRLNIRALRQIEASGPDGHAVMTMVAVGSSNNSRNWPINKPSFEGGAKSRPGRAPAAIRINGVVRLGDMRSIEYTGEARLDDGKLDIFQRSARHSPTRISVHSAGCGYELAGNRQLGQDRLKIVGHPANVELDQVEK